MTRENRIGAFLRARRAEVTPAQVGITTHGQRRVPGLRREEVAELAGVSPGYYTRIEQGQAGTVSSEVLLSIARGLRLDHHEIDHLLVLAEPVAASARRFISEDASEAMTGLMRASPDVVSLLLGPRTDILAWTPRAHALIAAHLDPASVTDPATRPNWARMIFTDDRVRQVFADPETKCWDVAAHLRVLASSHPGDTTLITLIDELSERSALFREMWAAQMVRDVSTAECRMNHPVAGALDLVHLVLAAVDGSGQLLAAFYAEPGSASADALTLLDRDEDAVPGSEVSARPGC